MKKRFFTTIILLFFFLAARGQELVGGYSAGYGAYSMKDMKGLQESALELVQYSLRNVKITEHFPGWIFQNAYLGLKFNRSEFGFRYDFFTTDGRIHLADYSGEYRDDVFLKGNAVGAYYKFQYYNVPIGEMFSLKLDASLSGGVIFNKFREEGELILYDLKRREYEEYSAKSINGYILPAIGAQFWYKNLVSLQFNFGYQFDIQGKLEFDGFVLYESFPLKVDQGINWSGIRASLGVGFAIPMSGKKK